jgi:hypothetical protein
MNYITPFLILDNYHKHRISHFYCFSAFLTAGSRLMATTDSNHNLRIYPNLAGSIERTGIDQLRPAHDDRASRKPG